MIRFPFLIIFLFSCTNDPYLVQEFIFEERIPVEQIKQGEFIHTEQGNLKVKINADLIQRYQEEQPALLFSNNISVVFYDGYSKIISKLNSELATIDEEKKIMTASRNVILEGVDKKIETQELIWDEKTDKIYTDKKVKITTSKEVIFGEGFISNIDFSVFSIEKINGMFNVDLEE